MPSTQELEVRITQKRAKILMLICDMAEANCLNVENINTIKESSQELREAIRSASTQETLKKSKSPSDNE